MKLPYVWRQGEHVALIGRTGSGKSLLASHILPHRKSRIVIRTKPDTVDYGGEHVTTLARLKKPIRRVYELEPDYDKQRVEIWKTLEWIYRTKGWCVYFDELFNIIDSLRLNTPEVGAPIDKLLTQGRSKGITVVSGMQRPARITRFAISEATHVISFAIEGREAKTVGEATNRAMEDTVQTLKRYEFAWYYAPERSIWRGTLNLESGRLTKSV